MANRRANDVADTLFENRLRNCAAEFEKNAADFEALAARVSRAVFTTIWRHGYHRELIAESRERIEKSRLLLYLTKQLVPRRERKPLGVAPAPAREVIMDRSMILRHLAQTEEHIRVGAKNIARQEEIIRELEAHGHDSWQARRILASFEQAQSIALSGREMAKQELARCKK